MTTTPLSTTDFAVIGGGIAGASVACELAADSSVLLLEMESAPGYHTTGRSAAVFAPCYGPQSIRDLTRASESFFRAPPEGFADVSLFSPRPILMIAREDQREALDKLTEAVAAETVVRRLTGSALSRVQPLLRKGYATDGMLDELGQDIEVNALLQGYLRQFKARGGSVRAGAIVTSLNWDGTAWRIETTKGEVRATVIINAAGAWADEISAHAGAEAIGLIPKRRTAMIIADHATIKTAHLPITIDVDEEFYLKPDAGRLLISPADETPSVPCDAQPEELDIAIGADRIMTAFDLTIRRIESSWAGLRNFAPDGAPVVGYSDVKPGFFWLAGQGGYGIQSAPAMAQFAAAAARERPLPGYIAETGFDPQSVRPGRARIAA